MDINARVGLEEFLNVRRQIMQANAVNRGNANGAADHIAHFLKLVEKRVVRIGELLGVIVKDFPLPSEAELLFAAFDEERFELSFERANLLTHSRLRDTIDLGGFGETFRFGEVTKDFQAFNLHTSEESNRTYDSDEVL